MSSAEVHSAPRNTEEGRALLQSRLSQFGRIGMALSATLLAVSVGIALSLVPEGSSPPTVGIELVRESGMLKRA